MKKTIKIVEPLSKRDLLGIISIFDLNGEIPNAKGVKISTLRTNFKNLVESKANEELNNYLILEGLIERALETKRKETTTSTVKHNKTKKLFNFILSKYLEIELEELKKKD